LTSEKRKIPCCRSQYGENEDDREAFLIRQIVSLSHVFRYRPEATLSFGDVHESGTWRTPRHGETIDDIVLLSRRLHLISPSPKKTEFPPAFWVKGMISGRYIRICPAIAPAGSAMQTRDAMKRAVLLALIRDENERKSAAGIAIPLRWYMSGMSRVGPEPFAIA
jgi:hypothetical protein